MAGSGGPLSRDGLRGREPELAELRTLIASVARDGCGAVALLRGEAGIGKSTLLAEAIALAEGAGYSTGLGKADELHHLVPLSSLAGCLLGGARPLLSGDAFADLARHHDQRIRLVERLAEVIEARAGHTPVLIALDDVQWADQLSRFALRQLPARLQSSPVLWLLTGRSGPTASGEEILAAARGRLPVSTFRLGPLSPAAMSRLASDTLGTEADEPTRILLEGAGGNPFLAVELLQGLLFEGGPQGASGRTTVRDRPSDRDTKIEVQGVGLSLHGTAGSVPTGLVAGVRGRIDSLGPATRDFLRMGAVLGRQFAFADAAALCGQSPAVLITALDEAVRTGLLEDDGKLLSFRHDLLRQAVYSDISPSARNALHRAAAHRLVASGHRPIDAVSHMLLGAEAGDEVAVALLRQAADDVLPVTPGLAADLMTRALELISPSEAAWFDIGEQAIGCLIRAGRNREALTTCDRLLDAHPPLAVFGRLQAALGGALWNLDLAEELCRRTEAALAVGSTSPEVGARLRALRALALSRGRDLDTARAAGEEALAAAVSAEDRQAHVLALAALGEVALNSGDGSAALTRFTALSVVDGSFRPEEVVALQHMDRFDEGDELLRRAADGAGSHRQAMLLWAQAQQHLGRGRLDDAEAHFVTMEALEDAVQIPVQQVNSRVVRAWIALQRGDRAGAGEQLMAARQRLAVKPNPGNRAAVGFLEAVLAGHDGDVRVAAQSLWRLQEIGPFMRWRLLRTWVGPAVRAALLAGDRALAEDLSAQAAAYAERNPEVPTAMGIAALTAGLTAGDVGLLERSVTLLEAGPRPMVLAEARTELGRALLTAGRTTEAATVLALARDAFVVSGAVGAAAGVRRLHQGPGGASAAGAGTTGRARPVQGWEALTASERKVARLVAAGHTNRSAAEALFVSPHTVNTHLTSVFRKLTVTSRVQLTHVVLARGDAE
ncbi:helix-turn-helix transcriptional regulator [Streptomyces sp. NPDC059524]|uniref:helix-turn-helix transcriptional regulator n=1 Tax=Streptomyces sp. NPDC059524 TaxID=3346856 RepID=UPI0036C5AF25